jgi:hypothetical protein
MAADHDAGSDRDDVAHWLSVAARALVYQNLQKAELQNADLVSQIKFLTGFGLTRRQAADMLGTTTNSVNVAFSRHKAKTRTRANARKGKK